MDRENEDLGTLLSIMAKRTRDAMDIFNASFWGGQFNAA
jgi:hypothetical protein